jgi:hypothetical protein
MALGAIAAFALGSTSGSNCPASATSYSLLDTTAACESAATIANRTYGGTGTYSSYPTGCYWHTVTGSFYFNTDEGIANYFAQPLCAGAPYPLTTGIGRSYVPLCFMG